AGGGHACAHDGHTTMLLGAARYLAETRDFAGTVNFIFQPAEEGIGGAKAMLHDGLFERFPCDSVFGMHNRPDLPWKVRHSPRTDDGRWRILRYHPHGDRLARSPPRSRTCPRIDRLTPYNCAPSYRLTQHQTCRHSSAERNHYSSGRRLQCHSGAPCKGTVSL